MIQRRYSQGAESSVAGVSFRTWATEKKSVSVVLLDASRSPIRELPAQTDSSGYYSVEDSDAKPGMFYQYRLDGNVFPDPATRFQPFGVHGPSEILASNTFVWSDQGWRPPKPGDLIIYELHVGTFSSAGTFRAVIEHFDHLLRLGVNAIEIMPIADFPGNRNWGYDGVNLYAPCRAYGRPDDLRYLVNTAHAAGLAVILDVVYNHFGPDGNYFGAYSKDYFNPEHHTPWGAAFNFDGERSAAVRSFFLENATYWREEFHFDGFRLDATHAIPDNSDTHVIQEITEEIQGRGGLVICEDPRNERRIVLPRSEGGYGCDAVWADDFHHVVRTLMTGEDEGYLGYFEGTPEQLLATIREGWLFTGQLQKDGIPRGTKGVDLAPDRFVVCISNHDQVGNRAFGDRLHTVISPESYRAASALCLLVPYTPMLFMGQEWACSSPFCYFTDHEPVLGRNISKGRRKEFEQFSAFRDPKKRQKIPDPQAESTFLWSKLNWQEISTGVHPATLRLYQEVTRFRQTKLTDRRRGIWRVELVAAQTLALRYSPPGGSDVLILAQLLPVKATIEAGAAILRLANGFRWEFALSSNEPAYGGEQPGFYDPKKDTFSLIQPETIVLVAHPSNNGGKPDHGF
jgi:maltooligosyltrehalose trehalohydrolase